MNVKPLLEGLEFHDAMPFAQPLLVDQHTRIIRWTLNPGQTIAPHEVPESPFYVVVLQGRGRFSGADGRNVEVSAPSLLVFAPNETHSVAALDEPLVFISFLEGAEWMRPNRTGGELGRE